MRILKIEPGGYAATFQVAHNFADALGAMGHQVALATGVNFETKEFPRRYLALEVFDRFTPRPRGIAQLIAYLRSEQPEIVHIQGHSHPTSYLALCALIRAFASPRFVYTAQDPYPKRPKPHHPFVVPMLYRKMDHIFVNAEENKRFLCDRYRLPPDKITSIPLADLTAFLPRSAPHPLPFLPRDRKIVLFFGNLEPRKGVLDLITAFPAILQQVPDASLVIIGKPFGDDPERYARAIAALPGEARDATVFRPDYLPLLDVPALLPYSHVYVTPYLYAAPNSGSIATAFGFALPVVSSDLGGIHEVIDPAETGFLVPPSRPDLLADAVIKILADPVNYQRMREAVRKKAAQHSWAAVAEEATAVYSTLLDQKRPARN